ncbi:MAG: ribosome small subunit-dependent GTPase A [Planctomycetota bacterium]
MAEGQPSDSRCEGRVVRVDAKVVHVDVGEAEPVLAALRGALFEDLGGKKNPVAVGDLVHVDRASDPASLEEVLPRRNYLGRVASSHDPREQVLVANVDRLFVIGALKKPGFSSNRTDRILAACHWHDIPAMLVFNKADLDPKRRSLDRYLETYERVPGVEILVTSAKTGQGVDELQAMLRDSVSVFYGPSGAGKSTLLNAIQPGLNIKEGRISEYWKQGKHTTTYSRLHALDGGGYVVDTPGIRVFRLHGLQRSEVRDLFPDFAPFQAKCQYANCTHDHEPGCAVADAVEEGLLADTRYASYLSLLDEVDPEGAYDPTETVGPFSDE